MSDDNIQWWHIHGCGCPEEKLPAPYEFWLDDIDFFAPNSKPPRYSRISAFQEGVDWCEKNIGARGDRWWVWSSPQRIVILDESAAVMFKIIHESVAVERKKKCVVEEPKPKTLWERIKTFLRKE